MKPKEFIEKHGLSNGWKSNKQNDFLNDVTSELLSFLEMYHANNNIKGFENALKVIKMKWDSISKKIPGGIPEKLWNYYFATVIAPMREQMCPDEMFIRKKEAIKRKEEYERRKRMNEDFYSFFYGEVWSEYFNFWANMLDRFIQVQQKPTECFNELGLNDDANEEDVKKAYRELALIHHPDKGGKQEDFIKITDAKNKCLSWLHKN